MGERWQMLGGTQFWENLSSLNRETSLGGGGKGSRNDQSAYTPFENTYKKYVDNREPRTPEANLAERGKGEKFPSNDQPGRPKKKSSPGFDLKKPNPPPPHPPQKPKGRALTLRQDKRFNSRPVVTKKTKNPGIKQAKNNKSKRTKIDGFWQEKNRTLTSLVTKKKKGDGMGTEGDEMRDGNAWGHIEPNNLKKNRTLV